VSYIIVDLDGTLILDNDEPNQPLIDALNERVMTGNAELIVVSARSIDRLQETRAWLQEYKVAGVQEVHLNDFEGSPFATGLALAAEAVTTFVTTKLSNFPSLTCKATT
jgi:hypothetical protein